MKILVARDQFLCAVLDRNKPEELGMFVAGRRCSLEDPLNMDYLGDREEMLRVLNQSGPEYYSEMFYAENTDNLVLLDQDRVVGSISAEELYKRTKFTYLYNLHVDSKYTGQHLSDLLYQSVAEVMRLRQQKARVELATEFSNIASHRAAERNGYSRFREHDREYMYFGKSFDFSGS